MLRAAAGDRLGNLLAAHYYVDHYISCIAPDCGPEIVIALDGAPMVLMVAGLIGSIPGVLWGFSLTPPVSPRE